MEAFSGSYLTRGTENFRLRKLMSILLFSCCKNLKKGVFVLLWLMCSGLHVF